MAEACLGPRDSGFSGLGVRGAALPPTRRRPSGLLQCRSRCCGRLGAQPWGPVGPVLLETACVLLGLSGRPSEMLLCPF